MCVARSQFEVESQAESTISNQSRVDCSFDFERTIQVNIVRDSRLETAARSSSMRFIVLPTLHRNNSISSYQQDIVSISNASKYTVKHLTGHVQVQRLAQCAEMPSWSW